MSLRIVPEDGHAQSYSHVGERTKGAPSAPGIHDTLRAGVGPSPTSTKNDAVSAHPLEARLKAWEATQESLRMETLRRAFGMAEPIRRGMELKITRDGEWRPSALSGGSALGSVHEEILRGREDTITWEDVFTSEETKPIVSVHDDMERKLKM